MMSPDTQLPWPILRDDLQLLPGQPEDGHPTWTIYDLASHRYIKLPWYDVEILKRWHLGSAEAIVKSLNCETTILVSLEDIEALKLFLQQAKLLAPTHPINSYQFSQILDDKKSNVISWLLHHYLFISITLCNPDRILGIIAHKTRWITAKKLWFFIFISSVITLIFISQQWDTFLQDAYALWSWQGVFIVSSAIFTAKIFHELGHGLVAKRYGCRVPAMGLALLVMCPILWTNTTNAWRLTKSHERIAIDAGGVTAELVLGIFAAWLWLVLPDGGLKEAALALAASTWILAVTVNFNPLMRFDGYYITSDLLRIENMQERTFAYARWCLRYAIFGKLATDREPGQIPPQKRIVALLYAYATWIYRFFLFMGIAVLVYHATFKALGFVLMATEIGCFLAFPIFKEIRGWKKRFLQSGNKRKIILVGCAFCFSLFFMVPWNNKITLPAVAQPEKQEVIYSREFGIIKYIVPSGTKLHAGDVILVLQEAKIDRDILNAKADVAYWHDKADQVARSIEHQSTVATEHEHYKAALAALQKAHRRHESLIVYAPFDGVLHEIPPELRTGLLIPRRAEIGLLVGETKTRFIGFAKQDNVSNIKVGYKAVFYPKNGEGATSAIITSVSTFPTENLDIHALWNAGKGPIRGKMDDHQLKPERTLYRIEASNQKLVGNGMEIPGNLVVNGKKTSLLMSVYRKCIAVLRLEANL